ncbi:hypothetical protein CU097_011199 [Rhizopus azygosporus]|uniref:Uncharacterized protein n=1 Tax=Rhizopus azygosporus TaxID=86630 RepID=A0A367JGE4_RHIAZ|nr:hypothetical protein CU097_011199 [Rhizopus azygosporus]
MKSLHCVYNNGRFADDYTPDLQGFMSPHDFISIMNTFNSVAESFSPYVPMATNIFMAVVTFISLITMIGTIRYTQHVEVVLVLPISFLCITVLLIIWRRRRNIKFEKEMTRLCSCMNATENVRGINFKLSYLTPDQKVSNEPTSIYAITIEFDDRYNLLHQISRSNSSPPAYSSLQIPVNIYCPNQSQFVQKGGDDQ